MVEKKKRKTLPPRGDPKAQKPVVVTSIPTRQRLGAELDEREDFGENTFAGALAVVKNVLEQAQTTDKPTKPPRKKG
jgi:hypothetical protein